MHSDPIVRRIHACALARVPACLWGPPGSGKTARVLAYSRARSLHLERWLLSRCEPIDIKPRIYEGGRVVVCDPPEIERLSGNGGGLLFLDEFNRAARETEGAALDRIDSPPKNVILVAACNPPSKGQAARSLESAAANRFCHLVVEADAKAWADAQVGGWDNGAAGDFSEPAADLRAKADARASALVSAFIRRAPAALEKVPDNTVAAGLAWPSTRSWEYARRLHGVSLALGLDPEDTRTLIAGCVGDGAALEYLAYVQDADLPDPEVLLKDPGGYTPPAGRIDRTIAALTAVVGAVDHEFTDPRWRAAWKLIDVCVKADQADAGMVGADLLIGAYKRLARRDAAAHKALKVPEDLIPQRLSLILYSAGSP
jgi:hypothetical protein